MNGALFYGPKGRLASAVAIILAFVGALQASGVLALLPPQYSKVGLIVTALGLFVAGFSERITGGASREDIREAAARSDVKNAEEAFAEEKEKEIELDDTNR